MRPRSVVAGGREAGSPSGDCANPVRRVTTEGVDDYRGRMAFSRAAVDDPSDLGIDPVALDALFERVQKDIDDGRVTSAQVALARDGKLAVWRTLGAAQPESRYVIFSSTKPVVASAVWLLIGDGDLDVSSRVAELIPEFASNGKDVITVEQVLLHTSGFPHAPFNPLDWDDRDKRLARFAAWRCNWQPGSRFEYHPTSAHWVLAELIERCTGGDFRVFLRERILDPLGLAGLQVGVPREQQGDINELTLTGEPMSPEELQAAIGVSSLPVTEVTPEALISFNQANVRAVESPAAGECRRPPTWRSTTRRCCTILPACGSPKCCTT